MKTFWAGIFILLSFVSCNGISYQENKSKIAIQIGTGSAGSAHLQIIDFNTDAMYRSYHGGMKFKCSKPIIYTDKLEEIYTLAEHLSKIDTSKIPILNTGIICGWKLLGIYADGKTIRFNLLSRHYPTLEGRPDKLYQLTREYLEKNFVENCTADSSNSFYKYDKRGEYFREK